MYRIQIPLRLWRISKWRANTEREKKQTENITTYTLNLKTVTNIIYIQKNEETYNNKNTEQIGKELKEKNVSENSIRKERRGNEENNDKNYNNTITDLITSTEKKQRERESSESIIKKIGIIKRTEREEISS